VSLDILLKKVEEMSLMLVLMSGPEDKDTNKMLRDLTEELLTQSASTQDSKRFESACKHLLSNWENPNFAVFSKLLNDFIISTQSFLNKNNDIKFPHELSNTTETVIKSEVPSELKDLIGVDLEFLPQFIEKHTTGLDEFEGRILEIQNDYNNQSKDPESEAVLKTGVDQLLSYLKGYLHNFKGEAAIVGLQSAGEVAHFMEDLLLENDISKLFELMLSFKEWSVTSLKNFSIGKDSTVPSEIFIQRVKEKLSNSITPNAVTSMTAAIEVTKSAPVAVSKPTSHTGSTQRVELTFPAEYKLAGDTDVFSEFASEAEEHLNNTEVILLESSASLDKEQMNAIFRCIHSIKGASAYFNLEEIAKTSHITENLLDEARNDIRPFDAALTELVLAYTDLQKKLINNAKAALISNGSIKRLDQTAQYIEKLNQYLTGGVIAKATEEQIVVAAPVENKTVLSAPVQEHAVPDAKGNTEPGSDKKLDIKTFVKVETSRLDQLIDTIGEMCTYSQMLIKMCRENLPNEQSANKNIHQVEKIARELQDIGMSMRLDPIRGLFQKMSRVIWDTSKKIGKQVNFKVEGEDTELDRNLIEKLADPLMHMVRNAIDHGIEKPEERTACGKSKAGNVLLKAYHAGGSVHIEIADDGKGLDPKKLLAKAIEKGIADPNKTYTDQEVFAFIFAAGFSTAAVVTDVSGRGVGMDVVRKNIESMRGHVLIQSVVGKGTNFIIALPLTLAIIDGIEVKVGTESYMLPALSIVELIRPEKGMLSTTLDSAETFHFRGKHLPLFRLADLYGVEPKYTNPIDALIVVVESVGEYIALMVDEVLSTQSIVIKKLGSMFADDSGITGCAITANGDVGLILDVRSLVELSRKSYNRRYFSDPPTKKATEIIIADELSNKSPSLNNLASLN